MIEEIDVAFLNALQKATCNCETNTQNMVTGGKGISQLTQKAWSDLAAFYPERYTGIPYDKAVFLPEIALPAGKDYLEIVKMYLKMNRIPLTIETLVPGYIWGVDNLIKRGIFEAPDIVKTYILRVRKELGSFAEELDANYK